MKILAVVVSVVILLGYVALMRADPAWGFLSPRGGMVMLAVSLAIANAGIWLASASHRPLERRFQFAAAGWIWLAVQAFGVFYVYSQATEA